MSWRWRGVGGWTDDVILRKVSSIAYAPGAGASFAEMILNSPPGRELELLFTLTRENEVARATNAAIGTTVLQVAIEYCRAGQRYNPDTYDCITCIPGEIKLNNDSAACTVCPLDAGIQCLGGASFDIDQGYWCVTPRSPLCSHPHTSDPVTCRSRLLAPG
ncbi:hypothetical protein CYMTET_19476 [Cymbomonas tetramitiformis]|uniref:Tyrosine-protein kinase ephrin type A/B receptor-like domain-containing protein n=1 Tax=Cymbomonas tetramitiformis TaxID=36881 RepID=A0AAE0G602_9CHLO|nr:hypothetical protein CYMTET_19476 [Cymbomonas tetramitiformis]